MSYPPQGGGWQQDPQGGWQQGQQGGWQDPAGGYVDPASGQPAYVDPSSGQPAYVDPVSGQPTAYPAQAPYPVSPQYGYQQGYPGYGVPVMAAGPRTNGLAIAGMVVSLVALLSVVCYGVGGIVIGAVGAILGHVGKRQIAQRGEQGGGMALAGIIVGWISVVLGIAVVAFFVFFVWYVVKNTPTYNPTDYPFPTPT
ncbi:MAG: hypothetical protein AUG44_13515 [Actinobacteria bacterium 13_1_20CM_3_71_11]|nr:MAG: hypothetical protein AUG44_13515 [Actinobacteria bacterium 13_1_20CM_3_71_11]